MNAHGVAPILIVTLLLASPVYVSAKHAQPEMSKIIDTDANIFFNIYIPFKEGLNISPKKRHPVNKI
jgi:hypothetical protein